MKLEPIVISLLDTDFYKFNMHQVVFHKYQDLTGEYHFKCRNDNVTFTDEMIEEINEQVDHLCTLGFTKDELNYLHSIKFLKEDYLRFLKKFKLHREYVNIHKNEFGELVCIVNGPCYLAMPFEIYLLEIINETYFRFKYDYNELRKEAELRLNEKIKKMNEGVYAFRFAEFGCRRRLSREWQDFMVKEFVTKTNNCIGTSNVYLAMKYNVKPIGTFAHEFVQMYQGIEGIDLVHTNYYALKDWYEEYHGENGTALTDTLTTDLFLLDFNYEMASLYNGVRHDSGDPYAWGEQLIKHYKKLNIDPNTKTLLFSDSLNFDKAQKLFDYFKSRINVSFGIGTYCSNDTDKSTLNIVIKLQKINDKPVAKLSDVKGKTMCLDDNYLQKLEDEVEYRLKEGK
ncbi:MAG: nicotinate phosphoribosyltransferase [Erysipelotrichales bacterium]|nr:nicotinate phosphoribosyltransferase [Erysipelotrichales bacterium]